MSIIRGTVLTFNGSSVLLFRSHVPRFLVFWGIVICKKSFGSKKKKKKKRRASCSVPRRMGRLSQDAVPLGSPGEVPWLPPCPAVRLWQPVGCLRLFLGEASVFRRSCFPARLSAGCGVLAVIAVRSLMGGRSTRRIHPRWLRGEERATRLTERPSPAAASG